MGVAVVPFVNVVATKNIDDLFLNEVEELEGCLVKTLQAEKPEYQAVEATSVRSAAFPWLQGGTIPTMDKVEAIMGWPPIARELDRMGVRFVLFPRISFTSNKFSGPFYCGAGFGAAGCLGVTGGEQVTKFSVPVWDTSRGGMLDPLIEGESKGTSWAAGLIIPVWNDADTINKSCMEIVQRFRNLTGPINDRDGSLH